MRLNFFPTLLVAFVMLLLQSAAQAQLVQYNLGDDADRLVATTTATGFTSTDLALVNWAGSDTDFGGFDNSVFNRTENSPTGSTDDGISFTLTNNSGTDYNLTSFSFVTRAQASNPAADAYQYTLQAQVDGIDVGTAFTGEVIGITGGTDDTTVEASLSQVLADGASATFSIDSSWLQDLDGNTPLGTDGLAEPFEIFRANGFSVQGAAVATVPEPSSIALLGLGALAFIGRRRR